MLGHNMFTYCNNNPVNMSDPDGKYPIPDCIKTDMQNWNLVAGIKEWANSTFGAGYTCEHVNDTGINTVLPFVSEIVSYKVGNNNTNNIASKGNSSKPLSVYSIERTDNPLRSSAGLKINIEKFTLNIGFGLDNLGISGSTTDGKTISQVGLNVNIYDCMCGFEWSTTQLRYWDTDTDFTTYSNASINIAVLSILLGSSKSKVPKSDGGPTLSPVY